MTALPPLEVPGDVSSLPLIADYVVAAGKAAGLDGQAGYRLRLAVDEIASNIVEHGYHAHGVAGSLRVTAEVGDAALTIGIEDSAPPYDPREALSAEMAALPLEERREGGLGLYLVSRSVDQFDYRRAAGKNCNLLTVCLAAGTADRLKSEIAALRRRNAELEALARDFTGVILPLGTTLSKERSRERLLERIVEEAMNIGRADGGTLYLRDDDQLRFSIMRTRSKGLCYGGSSAAPPPFAPLPLRDPATGAPNYSHVATTAVLDRRAINIADIHDPASGYDPSGARAFDAALDYHTVSCLTVPLSGNAEAIGALQLLNARDPETGQVVPFNAYQQQVTESLASQAAIALYNQELLAHSRELSRLEGEMQIGREIQANFLPERLPVIPGWQLAARVQPARLVSGDFYDAFDMGGGSVGLVIADVCDKGVGAAIFMGLVRSLLRALAQIDWIAEHAAKWQAPPAAPAGRRPRGPVGGAPARPTVPTVYELEVALRRSVCLTNDYIAHTHQALDMFASFFFGVLVPQSGVLLYINSGHPPLLHCDRHGKREHLASTGPAIGIIPGADFAVEQITIAPGELVLGYTDGITDARDQAGRRFGFDRLQAVVTAGSLEAEAVLARIGDALRAHIGTTDLFDDCALLAVYREE